MEKNKKCLEQILQHLTKMICLTEFEDVKTLSKLVDMATSVSAQLKAVSYIDDEEESE